MGLRSASRPRQHHSLRVWLTHAVAASLVLAAGALISGAAHAAGGHRVITLAPHATEIIYATGAGEQIVGTVTSSDFPPEALELPRVGDGILLNQERIIMLKPTLLVGWLRSGVALQMEALAQHLGAEMIYSQPATLRDIPTELRRIGDRLGNPATASTAADALEARIHALETRYAGRPPVTVFIEVGSKPLYTIGDDPLLNDVLAICGGVNLYADTGVPAPRVPIESVLVQDPQIIVTTARPGTDATEVRDRWSAYGLQAALDGHIHIADPDALFRPGPRLIDASEALCAAIEAARQS